MKRLFLSLGIAALCAGCTADKYAGRLYAGHDVRSVHWSGQGPLWSFERDWRQVQASLAEMSETDRAQALEAKRLARWRAILAE